jgi:hypothetical protein
MKPERDIPAAEAFVLVAGKGPLCPVRCCRKTKGKHNSMCPKHQMEWWRMRYPIKSAWTTLRDHARGRGLDFAIPLEEFREICAATGYAATKRTETGHAQSLTIDRIDFRKGYVPGNIRVITLSENGTKGNLERTVAMSGGAVIPWQLLDLDQAIAGEAKRAEERKACVAAKLAELPDDACFDIPEPDYPTNPNDPF